MDLLVIPLVALVASGLTLYSGFGLGTVLLPAFALFFPVPVAVAATGVVHLFNNLFKGGLLWKSADWPAVLRFGLPAVPAAIAGAWVLSRLGQTPSLFAIEAFGATLAPTGAGFAIGLLMIVFGVLELQPWFQKLHAPSRAMPVGGVLTGFFGGLTGQQGALRSMFLLKSGLSPARFVATSAMIAILIDLSRLSTYAASLADGELTLGGRDGLLVLLSTVAAFAGAYLGARFVQKVTIGAVRTTVAVLMFVIGSALMAGLIGA
ncbi:MAG TPA: sulfite exporter TauE/SafE family protein [Caulobacteraceae bacterium]|nr:sulfite exporter TauE/SafE family protein [Caulobacteraceae bacterium]